MKILYLNKVKFPSPIPAAVFSVLNAYGFAQNRCETLFIARKNSDKNADSLLREYLGVEPRSNFQIKLFSATWLGMESNTIFYLRAMIWILGQRKAPFQLIVTRDPAFLPYLVLLKSVMKSVKMIYQSHNFYLDLKKRPDLQRVNRLRHHWAERCNIHRMDGILALQSAHRDLYRQYTAVPVFAGHPGFLTVHETDATARFRRKTVAYIGSFQPMKGIETAVRCYARACQPDWKLLLLGGRNEKEIAYAESLIGQYHIGPGRCEITGWLSYAALRKRLDSITVGLLLLDDIFYNRFLTAPSKLMDYLSAGIPVIATDFPSVQDFLKDGQEGFLIPPGDEKKTAASLTRLMTDQSLYTRMSRAVHETAHHFTWEACTARMLDFFETLED